MYSIGYFKNDRIFCERVAENHIFISKFVAFRLRFHPAFDKRRYKSNEERSLERIFFYPREVALFIIVLGYKRKSRR